MRAVLTMAAKDLRLMSRDWLGMFFIIGFPIAMSIFFGTVMGSMGDGDQASINIAVVDEDRSPMSQRFIDELSGNSALESRLQPESDNQGRPAKAGTPTGGLQVEKLDRSAALDRVRRGRLVGMIAIPKGFGETAGMMWMESPAIELGVDPSHKAEAAMLQGNIMQAMGKLMFARFRDPAAMKPMIDKAKRDIAESETMPALMRPALTQMFDSFDALSKSWADSEAEESKSGKKADSDEPSFQFANIELIDVTHTAAKGSREELLQRIRSKWDISFPQSMMWGILACAAGFAITIVRERKQGTFLRLQVAPVTRPQIVVGKATACFISVMAVIGIMCALGMWLGMRPRSPALLLVAAVCVATCFVGIMMLMSVIGKSEEAVSGAAWGANMLMAMFGGGMIPLLFMPGFMRTLSNASPVKWSILALEGSIWRGFTLTEMLIPCGILVAIGAICFAIGSMLLSRAAN
jgi:ABC-2 type transport system permease protein